MKPRTSQIYKLYSNYMSIHFIIEILVSKVIKPKSIDWKLNSFANNQLYSFKSLMMSN